MHFTTISVLEKKITSVFTIPAAERAVCVCVCACFSLQALHVILHRGHNCVYPTLLTDAVTFFLFWRKH